MGTRYKEISRSSVLKAIAFVMACVTCSLAISTLFHLAVRDVFPALTASSYEESYRMLNWRDAAFRDVEIMAELKSEENIKSGQTVDQEKLEKRKRDFFYETYRKNMNDLQGLEEKYGKETARKIIDSSYPDFYYQLEKDNFEVQYAVQIEKMKNDAISTDLARFQSARQRLANREGALYYAGDGTYMITNLPESQLLQEDGSLNADKALFTGQPAYYLYESGVLERYPNRDSQYIDDVEYSSDTQRASGKVYVALDRAYVNAQEPNWTANRKIAENGVMQISILLLIALICAGYLFWVTGRRPEDENIHFVLIDRIFVEINAAIIFAVGLFVGGIVSVIMENRSMIEVIKGQSLQVFLAGIFGMSLAFALVLELVLSIVRRSKARRFAEYSLICRILKFFWKWTKRFFKAIGRMLKNVKESVTSGPVVLRTTVLVLAGIFVVFFLTVLTLSGFLPAILLLFLFTLFAAAWVAKRMKPFGAVVKGVEEIRGGNLSYKIRTDGAGDVGRLAENINEIADGLKESAKQQLKAERMKSELITNVSHDLKTPLTSIINYTDLLTKQHLSPEEANEYVKIIERKAQRLKALTQDLFEISRVQSGNMTVNKETIDIGLLVKQSLAELDEKISKSGLLFKTRIPETELLVETDGRKMSRVFENLIVNALKYSLENSRVYVDVKQKDAEVLVEFKNIANYEMNFSEEEILERFVRGDKARTTEGNGLGLAIAQSYTEACGGAFSVEVDGDLFKACIRFQTV